MQPRTESVATILKNITLTNFKLVLWNSSSSTFSYILWFSDLLKQMGSSYNWKSFITSMTWFKSFLWPRFSLALALVAGLEGILKNVSYPPPSPKPYMEYLSSHLIWEGTNNFKTLPETSFRLFDGQFLYCRGKFNIFPEKFVAETNFLGGNIKQRFLNIQTTCQNSLIQLTAKVKFVHHYLYLYYFHLTPIRLGFLKVVFPGGGEKKVTSSVISWHH